MAKATLATALRGQDAPLATVPQTELRLARRRTFQIGVCAAEPLDLEALPRREKIVSGDFQIRTEEQRRSALCFGFEHPSLARAAAPEIHTIFVDLRRLAATVHEHPVVSRRPRTTVVVAKTGRLVRKPRRRDVQRAPLSRLELPHALIARGDAVRGLVEGGDR
jgi:hypothetical protein